MGFGNLQTFLYKKWLYKRNSKYNLYFNMKNLLENSKNRTFSNFENPPKTQFSTFYWFFFCRIITKLFFAISRTKTMTTKNWVPQTAEKPKTPNLQEKREYFENPGAKKMTWKSESAIKMDSESVLQSSWLKRSHLFVA